MQVQKTGAALLSDILDKWQLMKKLQSLRSLFLGASPALLAFSRMLVERLLAGESILQISEADLQVSKAWAFHTILLVML